MNVKKSLSDPTVCATLGCSGMRKSVSIPDMKRGRKGVSPIIATVLLIALVVVIAAIIFFWAKRFVGEACEKGGTSTENKCAEVNLEVSRAGSTLYLDNQGNVAIAKVRIKINSGGSESVVDEDVNLAAGLATTIDVPDISGAEEVTILPVLQGAAKSSACEDVCENLEIEVLEGGE